MKSLMIAVLLTALPLTASAQDPAKVDPGHYKVLIDNAAVRVLKLSVGTGEKSPMHSHPDAMLVPLASGKARFTMPDGKLEDRELTAEAAAYTPAFTHSPANVGTTKIDAILVEFKAKTAGTADRHGRRAKEPNRVERASRGARAALSQRSPKRCRGPRGSSRGSHGHASP